MSASTGRPRLLDPAFALSLVATMGLYLAHQLVLPVFPLFVERVLDEPSLAGLLSGAFMVATGLGTLSIPFLMGRWGRKPAMLSGLLLFCAVASYPFLTAVWPLLLFTVLRGLGFGISNSALFTVVVDGLPVQRRGEGLGYYQFGVSSGGLIGAVSGVYMWERLGFSWVVGVALLVVAFSLVSAATTPGMLGRLQEGSAPSVFRALTRLPQLRHPTIVFGLLTFSYGGIVTFGALYVIDGGLTSPALFFLMLMGSQLVARPVSGWVCDRWHFHNVLVTSLVVTVAGLVMLSIAGSEVLVLLGATGFGLGFGAGVIASQMTLMARLDAAERPFASAMFGVAYSWGMGAGAGSLALAVGWVGYGGLFRIMATVACVALGLSLVRARRSRVSRSAIPPQGFPQ
jgi:MFS family permease